jgi:hypothetical protein
MILSKWQIITMYISNYFSDEITEHQRGYVANNITDDDILKFGFAPISKGFYVSKNHKIIDNEKV